MLLCSGRDVHEDLPELPVLVHLGDRAGNHIEPFVGEDQGAAQSVEVVGKPFAAGRPNPPDGVTELGPFNDVDLDAVHVRAKPVDMFEQLSTATSHVHEGVETLLVHELQQGSGQYLADLRDSLRCGREVPSGSRHLAIEPVLAIESLIPRLLPRSPRHGLNATWFTNALAFPE